MIKFKSGQTILEVVIATTLISIAIIAALGLTNQSQKSANYAKLLDQATAFNNQAADYFRNQKYLLGWAAFTEKITSDIGTGNTTTYCFNTVPDSTSLTFDTLAPGSCDETDLISGTIFKREASLSTSDLSNGVITIVITTTWPDSTERIATLTMELTQWN